MNLKKKKKGPVLFSVAMWHALMVENELGQSAISINHSAESKTKMYRESLKRKSDERC